MSEYLDDRSLPAVLVGGYDGTPRDYSMLSHALDELAGQGRSSCTGTWGGILEAVRMLCNTADSLLQALSPGLSLSAMGRAYFYAVRELFPTLTLEFQGRSPATRRRLQVEMGWPRDLRMQAWYVIRRPAIRRYRELYLVRLPNGLVELADFHLLFSQRGPSYFDELTDPANAKAMQLLGFVFLVWASASALGLPISFWDSLSDGWFPAWDLVPCTMPLMKTARLLAEGELGASPVQHFTYFKTRWGNRGIPVSPASLLTTMLRWQVMLKPDGSLPDTLQLVLERFADPSISRPADSLLDPKDLPALGYLAEASRGVLSHGSSQA